MTDLRRLFSDVVRWETEVWDAVDRRLRVQCGIPMSNFDVMQVIAQTPSCRVYDISHRLSLTVGGTSKAVDRIEALGHLARRSNPGDKRSSIIELTSAGEDLFAKACVVVEEELDKRIGSELPAESLARLSSLITELRAAGARIDEAGSV